MRIQRNQRGGSTVEFALVGPLLFVLLFGIVEFAVAFFNQAMITNASREGARQGIVFRVTGTGQLNPLSATEIQAIVTNALVDAGTGRSRLISFVGTPTHTTVVTGAGGSAGAALRVDVFHNYQFLVFRPLVALLGEDTFPGTLGLRASTVMRME